jgi:hypothetical protein
MIKSADVLYFHAEPASFCSAAFAQMQKTGLAVNVLAMPQDSARVIELLKDSPAESIVLISPFQFWQFMVENIGDLRKLDKPIISYVSEHVWGNPFEGYRQFEEFDNWAHFYVCAQDSDTKMMEAMGRKTVTMQGGWVATDLFEQGPPLSQRIQRLCFVGHTADYAPGIYSERRRMLGALQERGLVDVLQIPRADQTAPLVAQAFAQYAGVFCPPANGLCHSIRVFEAASAGALVVESQPLNKENVWFQKGIHRLFLDVGISGGDLCTFVEDLKFANWQHVATAGCDLVRSKYTPEKAWQWIFAAADNAL